MGDDEGDLGADVTAQFDTYAMLDILEDALHDAQDKTLFEDYFGADETA